MTVIKNGENFNIGSYESRSIIRLYDTKNSEVIPVASHDIQDLNSDTKKIEKRIENIQSEKVILEKNKSMISAYKSMCTKKNTNPDGSLHLSLKV